MLILGDVFATVAIVVFAGLSIWASGVLVAIVFRERTLVSAKAFEQSFWKTFVLGLAVGVPATFFGLVLAESAVLRLFAFGVFGLMIATMLFGSGGLTKCLANRVLAAGGAKSEYEALSKGGLLFVLLALLPFFGWFIIMPLMLVTSLGAGVKALFRTQKTVSVPEAA